jgi:hypothetical protein
MGKKKLAGLATLVTMFPASDIIRLADLNLVMRIQVCANEVK